MLFASPLIILAIAVACGAGRVAVPKGPSVSFNKNSKYTDKTEAIIAPNISPINWSFAFVLIKYPDFKSFITSPAKPQDTATKPAIKNDELISNEETNVINKTTKIANISIGLIPVCPVNVEDK